MSSYVSKSYQTEKQRYEMLINSDIFKRAKLTSEFKSRKFKEPLHIPTTERKHVRNDTKLFLFNNNIPKKKKQIPSLNNIKYTMSLPNIKRQQRNSPKNYSNKTLSIKTFSPFCFHKRNNSNNIKIYDTGDNIDYTAKSNRITTLKNIDSFLHKETTVKQIKFMKNKEHNKYKTLVGKLLSF